MQYRKNTHSPSAVSHSQNAVLLFLVETACEEDVFLGFWLNVSDGCCEWPNSLTDAAHLPTMEAVASCTSILPDSPKFLAITGLLIDRKSSLTLFSVFSRMKFHLDRTASCEIYLSSGQSDAYT